MNSENTKLVTKQPGWHRHRRLVQFAEYMVGGGVYFWGGLAVFALCYNLLGWRWYVSKALADIIGWTANFAIQRYWAFYDSRLKGQDRRVIARYMLVNGVDLFIDYGIVASFVHYGITPYAGFMVSALFTTVWDYLWYRFWVFKPIKS
ncbi:MAG TPA: GtrA family protein [Candidatus Saccharimonadales bacterium]|nr:GtrA family protein [Candidatus Saccharimonadales bacterium]